jgi:hypothetical protein
VQLAAHFTWRVLAEGSDIAPKPSAPSISERLMSHIWPPEPQLLAMAQIEITLSTRTDRISLFPGPHEPWGASGGGVRALLPDAFTPRSFNLTFEKGKFDTANPITPGGMLGFMDYHKYNRKYGLRMTCDANPLPPLENWKEDWRGTVMGCMVKLDWLTWVADPLPLKRGDGQE